MLNCSLYSAHSKWFLDERKLVVTYPYNIPKNDAQISHTSSRLSPSLSSMGSKAGHCDWFFRLST